MRVNDLKKSKFLTQKDVSPPILVTIEDCEEVNVAKEGADPEMRWALSFKGIDKPLILNSTNGQIIESITGSDNSDDWTGKKIVLYHDPNVSFGGKLVGGIRCRAPKGQAKVVAAPVAVQPLEPPDLREPGEDEVDEDEVGF